ncbi:GNAT family N-acetyltransferase [Actinocrispum wychmicini]|uniref:Acetyltransferase (GNAT) family protein n=1 Tax=Actinocrispum wychmicini TaxID=1213861 RepID=A0A4R2J1K2_9PSEU|nr:GNAT family N-acetyltransferase [Actinocrispum wychmicini]TCO50736.1 acetyltransferase (GNAT) family protein [Actinocrispum wychmicini]
MRVDTLTLVREARAGDAAVIADVHAEAWRVAYGDLFESSFLAKQLETVRRQWSAPELPGNILVAERGHRIVAFAHFGHGEIFDCYARPIAWGTGVAGTLLTHVLETLADARDRDVRAWTLSGANRARHFYRKAGFRESGRYRERDYGDGRPVMELEYIRSIRHLHR